jgi:hypothetical protein
MDSGQVIRFAPEAITRAGTGPDRGSGGPAGRYRRNRPERRRLPEGGGGAVPGRAPGPFGPNPREGPRPGRQRLPDRRVLLAGRRAARRVRDGRVQLPARVQLQARRRAGPVGPGTRLTGIGRPETPQPAWSQSLDSLLNHGKAARCGTTPLAVELALTGGPGQPRCSPAEQCLTRTSSSSSRKAARPVRAAQLSDTRRRCNQGKLVRVISRFDDRPSTVRRCSWFSRLPLTMLFSMMAARLV